MREIGTYQPSGGLAPMLVQAVFDAVKIIVREFDTSVLVVEQNVHGALLVSDDASKSIWRVSYSGKR